ncbi:MAG: hypothetical protein AB7E77_13770, partial [Desulfobulbus sp.]
LKTGCFEKHYMLQYLLLMLSICCDNVPSAKSWIFKAKSCVCHPAEKPLPQGFPVSRGFCESAAAPVVVTKRRR